MNGARYSYAASTKLDYLLAYEERKMEQGQPEPGEVSQEPVAEFTALIKKLDRFIESPEGLPIVGHLKLNADEVYLLLKELDLLNMAADEDQAKLAAAEKYEQWAHAAMAELKAERDAAEKRAGIFKNALELIARTPDTVEDKVLRETGRLARTALSQQQAEEK